MTALRRVPFLDGAAGIGCHIPLKAGALGARAVVRLILGTGLPAHESSHGCGRVGGR